MSTLVAVVGLFSIGLSAELLATHGKTARGATIAEFELGGLTPDEARDRLAALETAAAGPVLLQTQSGSAQVDPVEFGLTFDVDETIDRLLEQPRDPLSRIGAIIGRTSEVTPAVTIDENDFAETLDEHSAQLERAAVEGGIRYEGAEPVGEYPAAGLRVDRDAARETVARRWLTGGPIELAMEPFSPTVSADTVSQTLAGAATAATAAPLTLETNDGEVTVSPEEIGAMLRFVPDGDGGLVPKITEKAGRRVLGETLTATESDPVSARIRLSGGAPTVTESTDGYRVRWPETIDAIEAAVLEPQRSVAVDYEIREPNLSTERARDLGVTEVVSEFTTTGFSGPSGENIRLVAQAVDGALLLPGETFSLNGHTGPRGRAQGYVDSTIIDHGRAATAVGGGISQFATTLYNAAYFAGLEDVAHTEHAYYISRYPEAREATVFEGSIDLQFRNNTDHGILIDTSYSSSAITVRMWSTKTVTVESVTGSRYAHTQPQVVNAGGDDCIASSGSPGFTTSNTRIIRSAATGAELSRSTRTVKYDPEPIVRCS